MAKKSTRAKLVKKLDTLWSLRVRRRHLRCVMCGSSSNLNAHHAIARKAQGIGVRWLLDNGVSLCYNCHINKIHGQQSDKMWLDRYIETLNELIPRERQEEIMQIAHKATKYSIEDLRDMVEELAKNEEKQ